jgi:hypothetical protein
MLIGRRLLMAGIALGGLVGFSLVPVTPSFASGGLVYTVASTSANEEFLYCASSSPGPCTSEGHNQMYVLLGLNNDSDNATVDYELVNGTAVLGVNFYGPATGEQSISDGTGLIDVPTMISNQTGPLTFTIKLTSASPSGNISSVGTETILPGNEVPSDCSMNVVSNESLALTCGNRPAGQQWNFQAECFHGFDDPTISGNTVTGDGTSTVTCSEFYYHVGDTGVFNIVS